MNRIKTPAIEIELDRKRRICFDYNAYAELQDAGYDFTDPDFRNKLATTKRPSLKMMRAILWAALLWEDPSLTIQQVGAMIPTKNPETVFSKITEAMKLASDDVAEQDSPPFEKPADA